MTINRYIDGFESKPRNSALSKTDFIAALDSVSKPYTNLNIRNLLKTHFVKIKHIKILVWCEGKALGYRSGGHAFKPCHRAYMTMTMTMMK